jgi:hypothetical protein
MSDEFWQILPGPTTDIALGPDGEAWSLGPTGEIQQWTGAAWSRVAGAARELAVGPGGTPWIIGKGDKDGKVHVRDGTTWKEVPAPIAAIDLAVDRDGVVWIVGADNLIYHRVGDTFQRTATGAALRIALGPDRRPWVVGTDRNVWHHTGQDWVPFLISGGQDVGVGADGSVWAIDAGRRLHRLDIATATWGPTRHLAVRVSVDPGGNAWAVRPDGSVIRRRLTPVALASRAAVDPIWQQLPGLGLDIAVGPEGYAWIVGTDWRVWQFTGLSFVQIPCIARRVAVGVNNQCWVIGSEFAVWTRNGEIWKQMFAVPTGALDLAVAPSGNVYVAANDNAIWRWTGAAPLRIPGAATRVAVDNNDELWIVGLDRAVYRYADGAWPRIAPPGGGALDIAAGIDGSIWVTAADSRAYRLDATGVGWIATAQTASNIGVGPDGAAWVTQPDTQMFRQIPGRRANGRDFVASLFWRHLGRAPDLPGLELHHARLCNRSISRDALDAEFANCPEARQRRSFVLRDFVYYVSWRWLGRDIGGPGFDYYYAQLIGGRPMADVEAEFRGSVEAQHHTSTPAEQVIAGYYRRCGRPPTAEELQRDCVGFTDYDAFDAVIRVRREARERARPLLRDFVRGLFWRWLGRDPGGPELDAHHNRLLVGPIVQEQMEEEFRTCPEAQAYRPSLAPLQILAACYTGARDGQEDVTARIRSWVAEDQLLAWWGPADLGAQGNGDGQVLVIVYRYGDGPARTRIFPTGWPIELSPREDDRADASSPRPRPGREQLTILGAAFGRSDVAAAARLKVRDDNRLYADVNDVTWGAPGPNYSARPLVVVYQVGGGPPIVHLTRVNKRAYVNAPPLQILGATYGTTDVTQALAAQVRNGTLEVEAHNRLAAADPWPGVRKTLAVVFRYGDDTREPGTVVAIEYTVLTINPDMAPAQVAGTSKRYGLHVLGAAYGLGDRTQLARESVDQDALRRTADDGTWGDTWPGWPKTLTVVYQIDGGRPLVRAVKQNEPLSLAAPQILGAAWGTLDVTDTVATMVRGGALTIPANNGPFADSLPGLAKSLVIVYRLGDQTPRVGIAAEGGAVTLSTQPQPVPTYPRPPGLRLLGAAWGLIDLTHALAFHARNFVMSLFARYIKRAPQPAELDVHTARLVSGATVDTAQEHEFATCPEAQKAGPPSDTDFVRSLCWRYLGHAGPADGVAYHAARLAGGTPRYALEEEFRTCPEAQDYGRRARNFRAGNDWGEGWPGQTKTLVIVYQVDDGPPQTAIAREGETMVLSPARPTTGAYLAATVRLLQDFQIAPEQNIDVAPGTVVPIGAAAAARQTPPPAPKAVHQLVLMPRTRDGAALPAGARVTLVCDQPLELVTDQPGRTTLYRLPAHVALDLDVPATGRVRLSLPVRDGQLTCPLLRARWTAMAPDTWAVVAPDRDLHQRMADLAATDLLDPQPGKTSPVGRHDVARASALQSGLAPVMRAALATSLRVRKDNALRLAEPVALEQRPQDDDDIPPHIRVAGPVALDRVLFTGAALLYPLRRHSFDSPMVAASFIDDIIDSVEDLAGSVSSAFTSGFDAVASAFTSAFNATLGGLEGTFRATVEGMQSLVSVAEKLAVDVGRATEGTFRAAQCVLVDATNGLVAFAVTVTNGVVSVAKVAIRELTDLALLVADNVRRVALEIKQIIEFLLMLLDWGDIVATQRYLADTLDAELAALPAALRGATGLVHGAFDAVRARLGPTGAAPTQSLDAPGDLGLGGLGDAFMFLFDRLDSFLGAIAPGPKLDLGPVSAAWQALTDALLRANVALPDIAQLAALRSPGDLLDRLKQFAGALLPAVGGAAGAVLELAAAFIEAFRGVLRARIYIPVLTDLIETFILGRELTLLNLLTLLPAAAYTVIHKLAGGSGSPTREATPPRAHAATMMASPLAAQAFAGPAPQTGGNGGKDPSDARARERAAVGLNIAGAVASAVAFAGRLSPDGNIKLLRGGALVVASVCNLSAVAVHTEPFGRWWPSELTYQLANLGSAGGQALFNAASNTVNPVQMQFGLVELVAVLVTGFGMSNDRLSSQKFVIARMSAEALTGHAGGAARVVDRPARPPVTSWA